MGTALERHSAVTDLSVKAEGFGVPGTRCDGMDVLDVHAVRDEALRCAREERKPQLVEAVTYRFRGHSMADPEEYRTKEEVEEWRKRDPIATFSKRLVDEGVLTRGRREARRGGDRDGGRGRRVRRRVAVPRPRLALRRHVRLGDQVQAAGTRWTSARPSRTAASASASRARSRTSSPRRARPTRTWATRRSARRSREHDEPRARASRGEPDEEGGADRWR